MEKSTDTSKRKMRNIIIIAAAVIAVAAVAIAVIINVWFDKHSSAKAAANAAFDAIYSGQYDLFVESTVYNSDCQEKIGLEELGFLQSSIKPMFDEAVEYLKEIDGKYTRTSSKQTVYEPGSDGFREGFALLSEEYPSVVETAIEKIACVEIAFRYSWFDETDKQFKGTDRDTIWCICVDGKWYAAPSLVGSDSQ